MCQLDSRLYSPKGCFLTLLAVFARNILGRTRLGAIHSLMARLSTVLAGEFILPGLGAVANTMTDLATVDAHDLDAISTLDLLLGTAFGRVTKFIAVTALDQATLNRNAGVFEALHVVFRVVWPTALHVLAGTFVAEVVSDVVLAVQLALKVHQRESIGDVFLL